MIFHQEERKSRLQSRTKTSLKAMPIVKIHCPAGQSLKALSKTMKNGLNTEGWYSGAAQPEPRLESNWKSAVRPEIAVHRHSPSNLAEQKHICAEEWPIILQSKCRKPTPTNPGWCRLYVLLRNHVQGIKEKNKKKIIKNVILTTTLYHCKCNKIFTE